MPNLEARSGDFKHALPTTTPDSRVKRRDLLRALAALALWRPALRRARRRRDPWQFQLDGAQRWSLVPREGPAVVAGAEIAVRLGAGGWTPLGALERVRRFALAPPGGGGRSWQVVGVVDGVEITAEFLDGSPPAITVRARGLAAEQELAEIRFFDTATARVPALDDRAGSRLWINGAGSADECLVVPCDGTVEATSHWQLAVLPPGATGAAARGLALSFGADDAGVGRFAVGETVVATSWLGRRLVGMALPPASATLVIVPGADPLDALGGLAAALPARKTPAGWASGHALGAAVSEAGLLDAVEAARRHADPESLRVILLDDGYQRSVGDWETNDRFPHGHRWLTDRIHEAGFQAGLWLAPFVVAERSGIQVAHPEWLLRTPRGDLRVVAEREDWGGRLYALDGGAPVVQDYLRELARHVVNAWGYDLLKLGALDLALTDAPPARAGAAEGYRAGLRALREGAGAAFVLACDAPLQPSAGLVDAMRVVPDLTPGFGSLVPAARASLLRAHFNGAAWTNDADAVLVGDALTDVEARTWASLVALTGGTAFASDALDRLPDGRLDILRRIMPVAPVRGRALDIADPAWAGFLADAAPAWLLAPVSDDWWMLAAMNWDDAPRRLALSLAEHGIRGPLAAFDVWEGARLEDVDGRLSLDLPAHGCAVLSLRRPRRVPSVLGANRHVVQGIMDLEDETWDGEQRTLSGHAVLLDDRPYELTIALPPGFHPAGATCDPSAEVTVDAVDRRAARLRIAKPPAAELDWTVMF